MDALLKRLDEASYDGDTDKLKQLLEEDPILLDKVLIEVRDNPLHIAALQGHVDFTSEVLRLKPEFARKLNREGQSALHLAAARGHLQVAEILVDEVGNDICLMTETNHGYMPIHIATVSGKHDVLRMLVERSRDALEKTTNRMETLLHLAVIANCLECVSYFIDQGVKFNEKDENGNTSLHLAVAKRNRQVITYLLDQEGIEINSTNAMGLTPLDVLLVSSLYSAVDISLVNTIRRTGGVGATELRDVESNMSNSVVLGTTPPSSQKSSNKHMAREKNIGDAQTLLIVATLVATMTFQAISNPPGGFIQLPFEKADAFNLTWYDNWKGQTFPAGRPVLFWQLKYFFILDSLALFSSISVILWMLVAVPKSKIMMKLLVAVVSFSVFCTALAFGSALLAIYVPVIGGVPEFFFINRKIYFERVRYVLILLLVWLLFHIIVCLRASALAIRFLWRKAGFKIRFKIGVPNRIAKARCWPRRCKWFKRIIFILFMVCVVVVFYFAINGMALLFVFASKTLNPS